MEQNIKTYLIDGVTYEQRELVLGQWRQLYAILDGMEISGGVNALGALVAALAQSDELNSALAVLLTPKDTPLRDKDLARIAADLEFSITPQQITEVINDFFTLNPAASILSQLGTVIVKLSGLMMAALEAIGSRVSASSSAEETTAEETPCSGAAPLAVPGNGSTTENGS
ncbi:hypothetical protein [Desulfuromonas acetoxidans]|uniref:Uncharacterized protein n=2 Tax=Desulfuromonas acetoxidans TaxID=891 RepID=Q1K076_DESA6|nr:hypothetical protein [Desulfuromonas acetoxidans]EAT16065.1 hypothetical protein Dace_2366 [Desulfuromonas acetoxidans DSM 684]